MRTIIEVPEPQIEELDRICEIQNISRAELIRKAIDRYLMESSFARREASFGIWKNKKIDSLKMEAALRKEWS